MVYASELDFSLQSDLYGLFANRRAALQALQKIADEHRLCYGLMASSRSTAGGPAFVRALGRCAGACCGKESVEAHQQRLVDNMQKMQLVCWPWAGAIALEESSEDMTQYHIIQNWLWLGAVESLSQASSLTRLSAKFDHDGYKILCSRCSAAAISSILCR